MFQMLKHKFGVFFQFCYVHKKNSECLLEMYTVYTSI